MDDPFADEMRRLRVHRMLEMRTNFKDSRLERLEIGRYSRIADSQQHQHTVEQSLQWSC